MRRLYLLAPVVGLLAAAGAGFATHATAAAVYYVSPFGDDSDACTSATTACATITQAISDSASGDTIRLAAGAYIEQVVLTSSRIIVGAGQDESTIEAPASLAANTQVEPQNAIVDISGTGVTVTMSKLTVAGPGPVGADCGADATSLDKGIDVHNSGTLNLSSAAVRNIYNRANQGCQRGDGISVGSAFYGATNDVGHATLTGVTISVYQKNGIAVRGPGSTLHVTGGRVTNNPSKYIASNGIEVLTGALGVVSGTNVSGNECNIPNPTCGNDPFTDTESDGVLSFGAAAGTKFTGMTVHGNDMGIYTDDGVTITGDNASGNRYDGIYVDADASGAVISNDTASKVLSVGQYGIITRQRQREHVQQRHRPSELGVRPGRRDQRQRHQPLLVQSLHPRLAEQGVLALHLIRSPRLS